VRLLRRLRRRQGTTPNRVDALVIGLGNPGPRYRGTRHNAGFEVGELLLERWGLGKPKRRYGGLISDGRVAPGGPRVALLLPQTYMNESGKAAGPARGELGLPNGRIVVVHDEIDLPFGEIRSKRGGGVAGHNGLKSLDRGLGGRDFWRVRVGVGRPGSTDPELVSRHVLGRFAEDRDRVAALFDAAAEETERLVERLAASEEEDADE
jgi:peptidyl-tRNA hydrolase, PTH1 family